MGNKLEVFIDGKVVTINGSLDKSSMEAEIIKSIKNGGWTLFGSSQTTMILPEEVVKRCIFVVSEKEDDDEGRE